MSMSDHIWLLSAVLGLCVVTFVTRSFFLLTPTTFAFSPLVQRALRYAPTAAIVAVISPEILMQHGQIDITWHNKALIASIVASLVFLKKQSLLLMITVGMLVFTALRLGLGW